MELLERLNQLLRVATNTTDLLVNPDIRAALDDSRQALIDARARELACGERVNALSEENQTLRRENTELLERLRSREDAALDADRYAPRRLANGTLVYAVEPGEDAQQQPPHYLCARCFQRGQRSHLQPQPPQAHHTPHRCGECGETVLIPNDITYDVQIAPTRSDWDAF